jgi:hypothetical protein
MSLFGHLALKFGSQPENLATEALGYVLAKSSSARRGFLASFGVGATVASLDLRFETQHTSDEQGRPDLAGMDEGGGLRVLVEAKFWAGFTAHQPVDYLDQLQTAGVLVVICPRMRVAYVWRELLARLRAAKREFEEKAAPGDVGHLIVGGKHLVLQSWSRALGAIRHELSGEPDLLADVVQLDGLCARMDFAAFIPMTSEELTSNVYRRVHEFGLIVDALAAAAIAEGIMSKKGARATAANGWYGTYGRLRGAFVLLHASTNKWTLLGPSPLWLTVFGSNWTSDPGPAKKQLAAYEVANPGSVHQDWKGYATVMLRVPAGAERDDVIASALDQLRAIGELVAPLGEGARDAPPPESDVSVEPA